jgi:succinate dehydrogenase/fumarate reductase flavoprotein subunit
VLLNEVKKREIPSLDEVYIVSLIVKNKCKGAIGINIRTGDVVLINAKITVLATGGYSRLYSRSSSRVFENFGDGVAMAFVAGAELMDMEMLQFHPTGMIWPKKMEGVLVTEAVRGEGGILTNSKSERFMARYDKKRMELSARDVVARANYYEIMHGRGTKHGGVYLDISHKNAAYIKRRLPKMYSQFKNVGIDITKQKMEVAPTAHYSMGGIKTDLKGQTSIKNLFAVGEVTGDVHGANRLGGNSLAETIVYGKIAGEAAARAVRKIKLDEIEPDELTAALEYINSFFKNGKIKPMKIKSEIQKIMWEHAGIIREKNSMKKGLDKLRRLEKKLDKMKIDGIQDLIDSMDSKNMLLLGKLVTQGALLRKESRGAHFRNDYKKMQKHPRHVLVKNIKGNPRFYYKPTSKPKGRLKKFLKKEFQAEYHYLE